MKSLGSLSSQGFFHGEFEMSSAHRFAAGVRFALVAGALWLASAPVAAQWPAGAPAAVPTAPALCNFVPADSRDGPAGQAVVQVVLSPRMPYALREWPRMAVVAQRAGFRVVAFRDPRVPDAEWHDAAQAAGVSPELRNAPRLDEEAGRACQVFNHTPAVIVARCGHAHAWPIWGVMPDPAWLSVLDARRRDLEALSCS